MPYPSNALTTVSYPFQTAAAASAPAMGRPDILTYCFDSRMVYVIPGETYDQALDIAQESFPELRAVDRSWIRFEVRVVLTNQPERKAAEIGRTAWSVVINTLARFEVIEVRVATPPKPAGAPSDPPPYETGWDWSTKDSATNPLRFRSPIPSSASQPHLPPQSLTNRLAGLLSGSSRSRHPF